MRRAPEFLESAATRRLSRPLTVVAFLLYATTLILPFVHGTVRILAIPFSRALTLPAFMHHLADKQPMLVVAMVAAVVIVLPLLLLLAALLAAWVPTRAMLPGMRTGICWLRWRAWFVVALGLVFVLGLRAAASATGGPQLRLLPGGWCFCIALTVAALTLTFAAPMHRASKSPN